MRLGIFSDVHANIEALSAVMEAYRQESIDEFYCLGDVVGYGASPNEVLSLIFGLGGDGEQPVSAEAGCGPTGCGATLRGSF